MSSRIYEPLNDDAEKGETTYFIPSEQSHVAKSPLLHPTIFQILFCIGVFFSGVVSTLWITGRNPQFYSNDQYETGFQEEMILPSKNIQLEQVRFKSPVNFSLDGHEFLVTQPGDKAYIGNTTQEVDDAWKELLWGRYFSLSEAEAKKLWGEDYGNYWDPLRSGFTAGFDVFHQLHCLNQIRQALHRDVYPETPIHGAVHTDHCIDQLRQSIMCWGSTAIVPLKYFEGYKHSYVKTDAVHTCRKFEPIREFVTERFNGSLFVPRPSGWVDRESNAF